MMTMIMMTITMNLGDDNNYDDMVVGMMILTTMMMTMIRVTMNLDSGGGSSGDL